MNNSQPTKEELFERFMKNSPIYLFFKDDKARAIQLSGNYEKMLGKPLQELLGKTMDDLFPSNLAKSMVADDLRTMHEGKPITIEEELNGRFYTTTKFPILEEGKPSYLAGYTIDITEQKQNEENIRFQGALLEHVPDAIIATDMQYRIQYWNKAAEKQYGWTADEVIGHPLEDFITNDYFGCSLDVILQKISQDGYWKGEVTQNRRDGVRIPIISTVSIITRDANKPSGFIEINHAIAQRKIVEDKIRESEEKYRLLIENLNEGVWHIDKDSKTVFVNNRMADMLGYTVDEMLGKHLFEFMDEHGVALAKYNIDRRQKGIKEDHEFEFVRKDGNHIYTTLATAPIVDRNGNYLGAVAGVQDITTLHKQSNMLQESKALFEAVVENVPHMIFLKESKDLRFVIFNRAGEELLGYKREDLLGKNNLDLFPPEQAAFFMAKDREVLNGKAGILDIPEEPIMTRNGERLLHTKKVCIKGFDGISKYLLGISEDITERKKAEQERLKYEQQLNQMQKLESLGILAGGIAHDFNNILSMIFGYIEVAARKSKDDNVKKYLNKSITAMDRARGLTAQLLTFAKGGVPIRKIGPLFPFVQETAQFALSGSNVSCNFNIPENLWQSNYDQNQIGQVVDNIVINAQQSMPMGGTIEITAKNIVLDDKTHTTLLSGNYVRLSIKDTGVGIPQEVLPHIFDPFFTTKTKGHGLGLTTSYSIVQRHYGCIDVESNTDKGSTFHIYLPAVDNTVAPTLIDLASQKGNGTFLVMDDEECILEVIREMLESMGYSFVGKSDGEAVIAFLTEEVKANRTVAGIILDLTVPGRMGGKATIGEIKKLCPKAPVFVMSGYAEDPIIAKPIEYGFTASLCKPFSMDALAEMLGKHLKAQKKSGKNVNR